MNVIIFGAVGGIGKWAVKHAKEKGYSVTAYVRNAAKIKDPDIEVIEGEINDAGKVQESLKGHDAVIWCVGIPIKRSYEGTAATDGHRVLIKAMQQTGVRRLIDWGTPSMPFSEDKRMPALLNVFTKLFLGKPRKEMEAIGQMIETSGLDWTVVRFLAPKNTPFTGKVVESRYFGEKKSNINISREDIAAFMVEQVEDTTWLHAMPVIGTEK
jgi:putative NADH-flavin reductase